MKVIELDKAVCLTTELYNPYPTRFRPDEPPISERKTPLVYKCESCRTEISFKTNDLEKHCYSAFTNLNEEEGKQFANFIADNDLKELSFLDFNCPNCSQAVMILFKCGPSGYWGEFSFEIERVLILKS